VKGLIAALVIGGALGVSPLARADPYEVEPDLAKRDADYAAARGAIDRRDWAQAVASLKKTEVREPESPDLQNLLGYSYRNLGQYPLAFKHYNEAIRLEPRHRGAHEYIGETYLLVGDVANARKHLAALKEICLLGCDELHDLEAAIGRYESARATTIAPNTR
jgi:tetratricopeptide (TPR) repeat protein